MENMSANADLRTKAALANLGCSEKSGFSITSHPARAATSVWGGRERLDWCCQPIARKTARAESASYKLGMQYWGQTDASSMALRRTLHRLRVPSREPPHAK